MPTESADHNMDCPQATSVRGIVREVFGNKGFVACVLMLASFAAAYQGLVVYKNIKIRKLPIPLKKPLSLLDSKKLSPYAVYLAQEIKPEVLDTLGTDQYIQWVLKDESKKGSERPADYVHLFVTYYTDQPDQVPHVPEVCYMGGGGYTLKQSNIQEVDIPALGEGVTIPVQILEFERASFAKIETKIVMYLFSANGEFIAHRRGVQKTVGNPYNTYAYFSKVELAFGLSSVQPTREEAIESGERFLKKVIPVLVEDHWPNWDEAVKAAKKSPEAFESVSAPDTNE